MATSSVGLNRLNLLPVTGTWAVPVSLYTVFLSSRIVYYRLTTKTYLGEQPLDEALKSGRTHPMYRATRCLSNFTETAPLALVLGALLELNGGTKSKVNYLLGGYFISKVLQYEFGLFGGANGLGLGRIVGYYTSQGILLSAAYSLTYLIKGYWGY